MLTLPWALPAELWRSLALTLQHANGERAQLVRQTQLDNP